MEWLKSACSEHSVPEAEISRLELCLHEAMVNVITHGMPPSPIALQLDISGGEATVTISDSCSACNPLALSSRPTPKTLDEAEPGGLGLLMIRKFSDTQSYRHHNGQNHFSFSVRWENA